MKVFLALLALTIASPALAADLDAPTGAVVLTIAGKIKHTNRPAFNPARDKFLGFHERKFTKAAEFDRAMLEDIGMEGAEIDFEDWEGPIRFQGPRLIDVLKEVGWQGDRLTTLALDGFGTKISRQQIDAHNWILATRGNGKPFGIGQRGPLWLVYDPPGSRKADKKEEAQRPWAIFMIDVQ